MRVYRGPINTLHTGQGTPPAKGKAFPPSMTVWQIPLRQHHNCCGVAEQTPSTPRRTSHSTSFSFFTSSPQQLPPRRPSLRLRCGLGFLVGLFGRLGLVGLPLPEPASCRLTSCLLADRQPAAPPPVSCRTTSWERKFYGLWGPIRPPYLLN